MTRTELKEAGLLDFMLALCAKHHVLLEALMGPKRTPVLGRARKEAYVYLRSVGMSYREVGEVFGKDHAGVFQALRERGNVVTIRKPANIVSPAAMLVYGRDENGRVLTDDEKAELRLVVDAQIRAMSGGGT